MKKILAIKNRRLGDTVLWTSSLQALVEMGCTVDLLFPAEYAVLFREDPRFRRKGELSQRLPQESYDAVLCFHASPSTEKIARSYSSKDYVIHYHSRTPHKGHSTLPIPDLGKPMKATERDLNVVRAVGWAGNCPPTKLYFSEQRRQIFSSLHGAGQKPLLLLGPESSRAAKEWPLEYYVKLSRLLQDRFRIGFFTQNQKRLLDDPRYEELRQFAFHIPTPTLEHVLGAMSFADLYIGGDSGLKHIAVALGVRTVTLFGPESIGEWHCYEGEHIALQVPVGCRTQDPSPPAFSWCSAEFCPLASHACLRLIRPEEVVKVLK